LRPGAPCRGGVDRPYGLNVAVSTPQQLGVGLVHRFDTGPRRGHRRYLTGLLTGGALAGPVRGDVGARRAALGAEAPAAVRRRVQVDLAAALVGADAEPVAAVLAQPRRQTPDRASHVLRRDRRAT